MLVEIYEKRAHELHNYTPPGISNEGISHTINITNYTADGYFVLLPDIVYDRKQFQAVGDQMSYISPFKVLLIKI